MNRLFRKYHRWIAIVFSLPLITTVVTGMGTTIAGEWLHQRQISKFLLNVHTLEIFGLEEVFPIINGIGLLGLLVTGVYMSGIFRRRNNLPPVMKN
jgi:hypothetical protein